MQVASTLFYTGEAKVGLSQDTLAERAPVHSPAIEIEENTAFKKRRASRQSDDRALRKFKHIHVSFIKNKNNELLKLKAIETTEVTSSKRKASQQLDGHLAKKRKTTEILFINGIDQVIGHERQGMPAKDIHQSLKFARKMGLIFGFRAIEVVAKSLHESKENYPTKGLAIKAKSSNWGPMAGFIPIKLKLSKLAGSKALQINKDKDAVQEGIEKILNQKISDNKIFSSAPLKLSKERLKQLVSLKVIRIKEEVEKDVNRIEIFSQNPDGIEKYFEARKTPEESSYIIYDENGNDIEVLVEMLVDADAKPIAGTEKPIIPDYDLLFVAPPLAHMDNRDNMVRVSLLADESYYANAHPDFGNTTKRIVDDVIPGLNAAIGRCVVQHGADESNPASNTDANYPATIFLPRPINDVQEVCMVRNDEELRQLWQIIHDAGYYAIANVLWDKLAGRPITKIQRASFTSAQQQLESSLPSLWKKAESRRKKDFHYLTGLISWHIRIDLMRPCIDALMQIKDLCKALGFK